jgi:hypothetical protein
MNASRQELKMEQALENVIMTQVMESNRDIEEMWQIYSANFPPGQRLFRREFDDRESFFAAMRSPSFIKFYIKRSDKVFAFSIVTDDEHVIRRHSYYDIAYLLKDVPEGQRLFWIFAFCFRGNLHYLSTEARAIVTKTFGYAFDQNSEVGFDRKAQGTGDMVAEIDRILLATTGKGVNYKDLEAQLTTVIWRKK